MFNQTRTIGVIGDIMLDEYLVGAVDRISPEAPVPVFRVDSRYCRAGGAANVANNIQGLGGDCVLVGRIGTGDRLPDILTTAGIQCHLVFEEDYTPVVKTRLLAKNQQVMRVDEEQDSGSPPRNIEDYVAPLRACDVVVVSDYAKGLICKPLMEAVMALGKLVLVDPKHTSPELYKGAHLLTPNVRETEILVGHAIREEEQLKKAGGTLRDLLDSHVLITRSAEGMSLFERGREPLHIRAQSREVYDPTGAGDTVIATIAMGLASERTLRDSVVLANQAAGIVVSKVGTSIVTPSELRADSRSQNSKARDLKTTLRDIEKLRKNGASIVFTNGCFDILHVGHTRLLQKAKDLGDVLIVGINSDASVRRLKGPDRPVIREEERAEILARLEAVDFVVVFEQDDPCHVISVLKPDIHVKGGDYNPDDSKSMPEAQVVKAYGGRVELVDLIDGQSTSNVIARILRAGDEHFEGAEPFTPRSEAVSDIRIEAVG